jgi:DNA-binding transcriptional LysR family regulator
VPTIRTLRSLDLDLLVTLHALLVAGTVSGAARALGVTQPTVSHALGRLRAQLDDPLLVRQGRRMVRTPRAEALAEPLAAALDQLAAVVRAEPFDPATAQARVRVGIGDLGTSAVGPSLLVWLACHAPGIDVDVERASGHDDPRLASGELDLVACATQDALPPDRGELLWTSPLVGLARAGHAFAGRSPSRREFLAAGQVVVTPPLMAPGVVEGTLRAQRSPVRIAMRVPYWHALPAVLAACDLVAVVPSVCAGELSLQGGLATFAVPVPLPDHAVWLAWSPARAEEPVLRWLRGLVARLARSQVADLVREGGPVGAPTT